MSTQNPYDKFLDGRPLEEILAETPGKLAEYLKAIGAGDQKQPAPGKWSPAEIVCHLADCELVFGFRLRQTLAEENPTIQPFDQDLWAKIYPGVPANLAFDSFAALRKWNLRVIHDALPAKASRTMTHPERGAMTFLTVVETMAGHDLNHLAQLNKIGQLQRPAGAASS
jgi:hypothetical protein